MRRLVGDEVGIRRGLTGNLYTQTPRRETVRRHAVSHSHTAKSASDDWSNGVRAYLEVRASVAKSSK